MTDASRRLLHPSRNREIPVAAQDRSVTDHVRSAVFAQPVVDMHTHLYVPSLGFRGVGGPRSLGAGPGSEPLHLCGIDELLTYHYSVDEVFRVLPRGDLSPERYWSLPIEARAEMTWKHLFQDRPPVSESCIGLLRVLTALGLDPGERSLDGYRSWFAARDVDEHINEVMALAGVERIVMTNEPFSETERPKWLEGPAPGRDERFTAVLRLDPLVKQWETAGQRLTSGANGFARNSRTRRLARSAGSSTTGPRG